MYDAKTCRNHPKNELLPVLLKITKLVRLERIQACVCVTAELIKNGSFGNAKITKSNSVEASEIVKSYVDVASFLPVPDEASCLIEEKNSTFLVSIYNQ